VLAIVRARWRPVPHVLMFGLGDCLSFALLASFMAVIGGKDPVPAIVTGVAFALVFSILVRAVRRSPGGRGRAPHCV
jgi:hypothetical protein